MHAAYAHYAMFEAASGVGRNRDASFAATNCFKLRREGEREGEPLFSNALQYNADK
jgi:hypothetical protein